MPNALEGIRVLDFTQIIAGPLATRQLAMLGAEVIKVEAPGQGDVMRHLMAGEDHAAHGFSPMFQYLNAGKRSLTLDLKTPQGRDIARQLSRTADIVVENFRPGVMKRLGLDAKALRAGQSDLIYCSISGYGQTGPKVGLAAFDGPLQADTGLMSVNGMPDGDPLRLGIMAIDTSVGSNAATAMLGALFRKHRTGEGQVIDISLLDSALHLLAPQIHDHLNQGVRPGRTGNRTSAGLPTDDLFYASDGPILITAINEAQIAKLLDVLGIGHLATDPRFRDHQARMTNRDDLGDAINRALAADTADSWEEQLHASGIPCARVRTIDEVVVDPQVGEIGAIVEMPRPDGYSGPDAKVLAPGYRLDDDPPLISAAPLLGAHTNEILRAADYSGTEIDELKRMTVI